MVYNLGIKNRQNRSSIHNIGDLVNIEFVIFSYCFITFCYSFEEYYFYSILNKSFLSLLWDY